MSEKLKIGYTQGVYDMFHIGHLNLLQHAKEQCDYLIVGVNADELVQEYKHKKPVVGEKERAAIVGALRYVDQCVIVDSLNKIEQWKKHQFDAIFIGNDWKGNARWRQTEKELEPLGARVVYLEYTKGVSSTFLRDKDGVEEDHGRELEGTNKRI